MRKTTPIDPEKLAIAKANRDLGFGWEACAAAIGVGYDRLRCALDPAYLERRQIYDREVRIRPPSRQTGGKVVNLVVPAAVLTERERAFSRNQTITAHLCGDPPFGRSALDRKLAKHG